MAQKFLSVGDNISGMSFREQRDFIHSFIPKNRTPVSSYRDMPQQILNAEPDYLFTGHGGCISFDRAKAERWVGWMDRWTDLFTQILDQPHPNMGMDPHWVEFYPVQGSHPARSNGGVPASISPITRRKRGYAPFVSVRLMVCSFLQGR